MAYYLLGPKSHVQVVWLKADKRKAGKMTYVSKGKSAEIAGDQVQILFMSLKKLKGPAIERRLSNSTQTSVGILSLSHRINMLMPNPSPTNPL